jgi:manganese/zinc/iron transport system permease protein
MNANLIWVFAGCILISTGASVVGCFTFLRKRSLAGDAVAHALLPGVALSFIIFEEKSLWALFPGAFIAGWLSLLSMEAITRYSKLKSDTAIAIVLSVFFAVGIVLLTRIQATGSGTHSGLDAFLFGKAAAMLPVDIYLYLIVDTILLLVIWLWYPYFKLYTFDPGFAASYGLPVRRIGFLLSTLTVVAIAMGIQAVGVVLMAALVITPAAAARFFSKSLGKMIALAAIIGAVGAVFGVWVSYMSPAMPTGPWIVVMLSFIAVGSFVFAPRRGLWSRYIRQRKHQLKVSDENILKRLYHLAESQPGTYHRLSEIAEARNLEAIPMERSLSRLLESKALELSNGAYRLSPQGMLQAARVVRLHRLWELYLNKRMNMALDHVHHDAEAIEHIITPELEEALLKELNYPLFDPHMSAIPGVIPRT